MASGFQKTLYHFNIILRLDLHTTVPARPEWEGDPENPSQKTCQETNLFSFRVKGMK
jgi:hypothetical protein